MDIVHLCLTNEKIYIVVHLAKRPFGFVLQKNFLISSIIKKMGMIQSEMKTHFAGRGENINAWLRPGIHKTAKRTFSSIISAA